MSEKSKKPPENKGLFAQLPRKKRMRHTHRVVN